LLGSIFPTSKVELFFENPGYFSDANRLATSSLLIGRSRQQWLLAARFALTKQQKNACCRTLLR